MDVSNDDRYVPKSLFTFARTSVSYVGLIVDGLLSEHLLESSYRNFISRWSILGGHLLLKENPLAFTYGHNIDFATRTLDTPLATAVPFDLSTPAANSGGDVYYRPLDVPADIFHWSYPVASETSSDPLFAMRVTFLRDATLLSFRIHHYFADGNGLFDAVTAFQRTMAGEEIPVLTQPPDVVQPMSEMINVDAADSEDPKRADNDHVGDEVENSGDNEAANSTAPPAMMMTEGERTHRMVHVSRRFVDDLKIRCQAELDTAGDSEGARLSTNDVLIAWYLKTSYAKYNPTDTADRPMHFMYALGIRSLLPAPQPGTTYLHNDNYPIFADFPSLSIFQRTPLSRIALTLRRCVLSHRDPHVVKKTLKFWESNLDRPIMPFSMRLLEDYISVGTVWTKFEYCGMDFSAAIEKGTGTGRVRMALPYGEPDAPFAPYAMTMADGEDGYWIYAANFPVGWKGHDDDVDNEPCS